MARGAGVRAAQAPWNNHASWIRLARDICRTSSPSFPSPGLRPPSPACRRETVNSRPPPMRGLKAAALRIVRQPQQAERTVALASQPAPTTTDAEPGVQRYVAGAGFAGRTIAAITNPTSSHPKAWSTIMSRVKSSG
jgi:hypothetical protein